MSKVNITIPQQFAHLDAYLQLTPVQQAQSDTVELARTHAAVRAHVSAANLAALPPRGEIMRLIAEGRFQSPIRQARFQIETERWNVADLAQLRSSTNYPGNVGLVLQARDLSILYGFNFDITGLDLPEQRDGKHFHANWMQLLCYLQFKNNPAFMGQFRDVEGLVDFGLRYSGLRCAEVRSDLCNLFEPAEFNTLEWSPEVTQVTVEGVHQARMEDLYGRLLRVARELDGGVDPEDREGFLSELFSSDGFPDLALGEKPVRSLIRFGRVYWEIVKAGIDTSELDNILSSRDLNYRSEFALYKTFVSAAREEQATVASLVRRLIELEVIETPGPERITRGTRDSLLKMFGKYAIDTADLKQALEANLPYEVFEAIVAWGEIQEHKDNLMFYVEESWETSEMRTWGWLTDPAHAGPLRDQALEVMRRTKIGKGLFLPEKVRNQIRRERARIVRGEVTMGDSVLFMSDPRKAFERIVSELEIPERDLFVEIFMGAYTHHRAMWALDWLKESKNTDIRRYIPAWDDVSEESIYPFIEAHGMSRQQFAEWRQGLAAYGVKISVVPRLLDQIREMLITIRDEVVHGNAATYQIRLAAMSEITGLSEAEFLRWVKELQISGFCPPPAREPSQIREGTATALGPEEYLSGVSLKVHRALGALAAVLKEHESTLGDAADGFSDEIDEFRRMLVERKTVLERDVRHLAGRMRRALTSELGKDAAQDLIQTALSRLNE